MYTFSDSNVLNAAQLNGNFGAALDKATATPQTVVGAVTFSGGVTTTGSTINGVTTLAGAEVANVTVLTAAGNYVVSPSDRYVMVNKTVNATTQITLPSSSTTGRLVTVKDLKGTAGSFNVTVVPSGSDTIDGGASVVLNTNYEAVDFLYAGGIWAIV